MKPILRRDALLALAASVSAAALAPAARADEAALLDAARKEGPMTWYISFYAQDLPAQAAALFAKQYPGLTVTPVRLTTGGTFQRLFQDLRNNVAIASVVTATGIGGQYTVLLQGDKLARYTPQAAGQIRPGLKTATTPDYIYPMGAGLFALCFALVPLPYYLVTVQPRFRHPLEPLIAMLAVYLFRSTRSRAATS